MRTTTTQYTCDLCGAAWTTETTARNVLPGFPDNLIPIVTHFGATTDYCEACVQHVQAAIERAKAERAAAP